MRYLFASSAAFGLISELNQLHSRQKSGKAFMSIPEGAHILMPLLLPQQTDEPLYLATLGGGNVLVFPLQELIDEARGGRGSKLMALNKDEPLLDAVLLRAKDTLRVHTSGRFLNLSPSDWQTMLSQRARRGRPLPRGFARAERLESLSND